MSEGSIADLHRLLEKRLGGLGVPGDVVQVANGTTPGIAVDSLGNVHVVYMSSGNIYYRTAGADLVFGGAEQI